MKIVCINGGLGNQISQYVLGRFLEKHFGYDVWYDTIIFDYYSKPESFQLCEVFSNVKFNAVRNNFDDDVWLTMASMCRGGIGKVKLPNILLSGGLPFVLVADEYIHAFPKSVLNNGYSFDGTIYKVTAAELSNSKFKLYDEINQHEHVYFMGTFLNNEISKHIKEELRHELKFKELQGKENIAYRDDILSKLLSVGLHVRRGDFIKTNKSIDLGKYVKVIKKLKFSFVKVGKPTPHFYIFSDDIAWCKENINKLGFNDNDNIVFITGNEEASKNYIDMQLMSFCDYLIYNPQSSFCRGATHCSDKDIVLVEIK